MNEKYRTQLRQRIQDIVDLGVQQEAFTKAYAGVQQTNQWLQNMPPPNAVKMPKQAQTQYPTYNPYNASTFNRFVNAIGQAESGGNYRATNPSGALGKYQILAQNIQGIHSGWDWEVLHRDISPAQFLNSPQIQEAIARYKLQDYYNKYGPAGAAVAWYGGPGAVGKNPGYGAGGGYPGIGQYSQHILDLMRKMKY